MASRHSTGVTYSFARNSCLNTSMRLECAICGRGAEFPRASAQRCLTFPHGVYSAHRFSSRSFSSPTRCTGFADSPPVDGKLLMQLHCHGELPTPPRFRFMVSVTRFPPDVGFLIHRVCLLSAAWIQYVRQVAPEIY